MHSVDPVAGKPDNGTAFTKAANLSLGNTAYDVIMDDDSEGGKLVANLYEDEGESGMDLDIDQIHQDTRRSHQRSTDTKDGMGTASKESWTTESKQSESNDDSSQAVESGGSKNAQTVIANLAKLSLKSTKLTSKQGREGKFMETKPPAHAQE